MDLDSKFLYQLSSTAFDRLKAIENIDSKNDIKVEKNRALIAIYRSILDKVPQFLLKQNRSIYHFYFFYGSTLYYLNKDRGDQEIIANSIRLIKKAISQATHDDKIEYTRVIIELLIKQKKHTEALQNLQYYLHYFPHDKPYLMTRIKVLLKMNRVDEAILQYLKMINHDPFDFELYFNCGKLYLLKKEYDNAVRMFQKSKEVEPKFPDNYQFIGKIMLIQNRKAIAGSNFKTALARKLYNHQQYENNQRMAGKSKVLPDPRDNQRNTMIFLFGIYLDLIKCGEDFHKELMETEKTLLLKDYMTEEKVKAIKMRYMIKG